jgi:hypothetical protein
MHRIALVLACLAITFLAVGAEPADARLPQPGDACWLAPWAPGCWDSSNGCPPPPYYCMPP